MQKAKQYKVNTTLSGWPLQLYYWLQHNPERSTIQVLNAAIGNEFWYDEILNSHNKKILVQTGNRVRGIVRRPQQVTQMPGLLLPSKSVEISFLANEALFNEIVILARKTGRTIAKVIVDGMAMERWLIETKRQPNSDVLVQTGSFRARSISRAHLY